MIHLEASPLIENEYTGISNVVCELTQRFLRRYKSELIVEVLDKIVPLEVISRTLNERSGAHLNHYLSNSNNILSVADYYARGEQSEIGFYMHRRKPAKVAAREGMLFYDFTYLMTPECHSQSTIDFWRSDIVDIVKTCDFYVCISHHTAKDLYFLFGDDLKARTVVAHLGCSLSSEPNPISKSDGERPFLLFIGTVEPRKNIGLILDLIRAHPRIIERFDFVFVGRDGWNCEFANLISDRGLQELKIENRIRHLSYVSEAAKVELLTNCAALIYPSFYEGFGLPVLEAMSIGTPVISSCSTSLPEVLGPDGIYFDPYSVPSLKTAIDKIMALQRQGMLGSYGTELKKRSIVFSYDNMFEKITEAF